ncbi:thap domain-containing protein 9-like protein, partial [Lasius niger]
MYQQKCRRLEKKVVSLTLLMKHLQDQKLLSEDAAELLENTVSETERQIIKRHLKGKKRGAFPSELKTFAVTLQFYSTKAYEYVRKTFLNILLHPQTIRKWYSSVEEKPEITREALRTIEAKINEAATEGKILYFSLTMDDMSIRKLIEIENDKYYGYVDLGTSSEHSDNLPEAKYACVFLLVCIN